MAFREVYGGENKPKGRRFKFKDDYKREVICYLIIEPSDTDYRDQMNARYADRKRNPQGGYTFTIPPKKDGAATKFLASLVWADTENAWVTLGDQEAVDFYGKELGESFEVGQAVCLDGRLTDAIKKDMLEDDLPLANWIVGKATDAEAEVAEAEEEEASKNSQSSSSSGSGNTQVSPIRSAGNAS